MMTDYTDLLTRLDNKAELNLTLNKEASEAIRQLVIERDKFAARRCEVCGYMEHHREHTGCLRKEVEKLTAERDAAFAMSKCECESNEACSNLVALHDEVERMKQERDDALVDKDHWEIRAEAAYRLHELHNENLQDWISYGEQTEKQITTLKSALREVVKAFDVVEIDSDECLDFDECTAMFVPLDAYHGISEAITTIRTALGETE